MFNNKNFVMVILLAQFSFPGAQSLQEMQKMKKEYEAMKQMGDGIEKKDDILVKDDFENLLPEEAEFSPYEINGEVYMIPYRIKERMDSLKSRPKYFGYDFFTRRDTLAFWENLPTPSNYLLGPGDELVISLWGETQLRQTYVISRDGKIYDEKVGLLNLLGKTVEEAKQYFISQFGRVYATLVSKNPSTYLDVSLGQLRSINVNFVGEVKYPGVYPIHPFSSLISGLIQAGGVDTTGSLRNIEIKRDGKIFAKVDLYDYLIKGELPNSIQLRNQDIVVVPTRKSTVQIDSMVVRPGIYESKPKENLMEIINFAGGIKPNSDQTIILKRIKPLSLRKKGKPVIDNHYIDYANSHIFPVQSGDKILVRRVFNSVMTVEIIGQVKSPGVYNYFKGMSLLNLIELAGGVGDTTFLKSIYLLRGELVRRNPKTRYESVIEVNLEKLIKNKSNDIILQNLDRFVVHANPNYFEKENIIVLGEVNIPGSYPLISDYESLNSFISRAGGLTSKALDNGISIYRRKKFFESNFLYGKDDLDKKVDSKLVDEKDSLNKSNEKNKRVRVAWQNKDISIMPGDSVVVKEKTATVFVTGEVYNPGILEYHKGKPLRYYINSAGGITGYGDTDGIIILYPNGVVYPNKWYKRVKVLEGSTIMVNRKPPEDPFDLTEFATNWTAIISSMVTVFVVTKQN